MGNKRCQSCRRITPISFFGQSRVTVDGYRDICKECSTIDSRKSQLRRKGIPYEGITTNLNLHNKLALVPYKFNKKEITTVKLINVNNGGDHSLVVRWNKDRSLIMLEVRDWTDRVVEQYGTAPYDPRSKVESIKFFKEQLLDILKKKSLRVVLETGNDIYIYGIEVL